MRLLEAGRIQATAERLAERIAQRFPERGLADVARDVVWLAADAERRSLRLARVHLPLRAATWTLGFALALGLAVAVAEVPWDGARTAPWEVLQGLDAAANLVLLLGAGILGTSRWEQRRARNAGLSVVHELKALAHLVDMHQLSKRPSDDPLAIGDTASSPRQDLPAPELLRYLDYCAELLSLLGKIAAFHGQRCTDATLLAALDEVEELTTGLSRKVWQKIGIVERRRLLPKVTPAEHPGS